jgi:ribokinase
MARFAVVGSLNMDLVARVDRFPKPGETRSGSSFATFPGGKGANQAVALARLGGNVRMAGKLGDDVYGESYRRTLEHEQVAQDTVHTEHGVSSGIAMIEIDDSGENNIVIVPGANGRDDRSFIDTVLPSIAEADVALFQLEIPLDAVSYALARLKERGTVTILDPAPAIALPEEIYASVDYLTPNEHEARTLLGEEAEPPENGGAADPGAFGPATSAERAARALQERGARNVVVKLGSEGAYALTEQEGLYVRGFAVEARDTTAAGDAFNAGLALALGEGSALREALRLANAAGASACTAVGAQSAMPTREQAERIMG